MKAKSLIAGNWKEGKGASFTSHNPANWEMLEEHSGVSTDELNGAVEEAQAAYQVFRDVSFETRADLLETAANELEALGDELLEICNQETGLGIPRLTGERGRTCGQLRAFASLVREGSWQQARIDTAILDRTPLPKPDIRRVLRPIGPVAVFSASNFPLAFATLGGDTASALAAGNSVVVKGHPSHPMTSELCAKAISRAITKLKLPKGIFSMIQGSSPQTSTDLVKHPSIQAVGFTGSTHVGRILFDAGNSRNVPIPVFAEMGSTNPFVVLPSAIADGGSEFAKALAGSITLGTGQFCTKPGLVFVLKSDKSAMFLENLVQAMAEVQPGHLLNQSIKNSLEKQIDKAITQEDAKLLTGGSSGKATLLEVSAKQFVSNPKLEEEIFGPIALVVKCETIEELLEALAGLGGHLTGSIHTQENDALAKSVIEKMESKVGRIVYNGFPTGVEVCPSMHHGGPYPSSTYAATTSVGTAAIERFCKVVCYQNTPQDFLPEALKNDNSRNIIRLVNNEYTRASI